MKPVLTYKTTVSVPGLQSGSTLAKKLNMAWGFEDGSCNVFVDGRYVEKGPYPEGFTEAHRRLYQASSLTLRVSVFKDGSKTFEII